MIFVRHAIGAALAGLFLLVPHLAVAQIAGIGGGEGISVYGMGEVRGTPNVVEMDLHVAGKAELTGDALVKYRDAKKRLLEAIEKIKTNGVSLEERGVAITIGNSWEQQQRIMNGQAQVPGKPQIEVGSAVRLSIKGIRDIPPEELVKTIGRLMDTAQDSGVNVGPNQAEVMRAIRYGQQMPNASAVRFIVADVGDLREKAYERAVADARKRAQRLATLHQVKLGAAQLIQEVQVSGDLSNVNVYQANQQLPPAEYEGDQPRLLSGTLSGVPVQVRLFVRFAIEPTPPATAQK